MSVNGIWTVEIYGIYDWEANGVLVLENGRALGGGNNHYSVGAYELLDERMAMDLQVKYFGSPRTLFGESQRDIAIHFKGDQRDDVINGTMARPDKPGMVVTAKLTKNADLPARQHAQ